MHITSLPGDYGIGSFGQAAYDFVDFLKETKQTYWQILPLTYRTLPWQYKFQELLEADRKKLNGWDGFSDPKTELPVFLP